MQDVIAMLISLVAATYLGRLAWLRFVKGTSSGCGTCGSCSSNAKSLVQIDGLGSGNKED